MLSRKTFTMFMLQLSYFSPILVFRVSVFSSSSILFFISASKMNTRSEWAQLLLLKMMGFTTNSYFHIQSEMERKKERSKGWKILPFALAFFFYSKFNERCSFHINTMDRLIDGWIGFQQEMSVSEWVKTIHYSFSDI